MIISIQQKILFTFVIFLWLQQVPFVTADETKHPDSSYCGLVTNIDGTALAAVAVTATSLLPGVQVSTFTDKIGNFCLTKTGTDIASFKFTGRDNRVYSIKTISTDGNKHTVVLDNPENKLQPPSSAVVMGLLPEGEAKRHFIRNCTSCHQISIEKAFNAGRARSVPEWQAIIDRMKSHDTYGTIPLYYSSELVATWLNKWFNSPSDISRTNSISVGDIEQLSRITITEYLIPIQMSNPHDITLAENGNLWITGFLNDLVWEMDPDTGKFKSYELDTNPSVIEEVRALDFDDNGRLWLVKGRTENIALLDPKTGDYSEFSVPMYAHSIKKDSDNNFWVNDYFGKAGRVARIDKDDQSITLYNFPPDPDSDKMGLPLTYGLIVDSKDIVWATQLAANKLVKVNPATGESKMFDMPVAASSPRRLTIDKQDQLWIPEYSTGHLTHFNPETEQFTRYAVAPDSAGLYSAKYNSVTNTVWMTAAMEDALYCFFLDTKKVLRIPLPTQPAFGRHLAIDPDNGDVWSSYSSYPPAAPKVVRIHIQAENR